MNKSFTSSDSNQTEKSKLKINNKKPLIISAKTSTITLNTDRKTSQQRGYKSIQCK